METKQEFYTYEDLMDLIDQERRIAREEVPPPPYQSRLDQRWEEWSRNEDMKRRNNLLFWIFIAWIFCTAMFIASEAHADTTKEGFASWYSSEACKNPKCQTASGRSLYELEEKGVKFAASWNYSLGTRVRVINLETGSSVEVLVLDRGPNKRFENRVIDLSKNAFEKIGESDRGLIPVRVETIK